jgi:uncharacterized repeat protein (TIGR03803 family)
MKTASLPAALFLCILFTVVVATAQTYSEVYPFSAIAGYPSTNFDGWTPEGGLVESNGVLYGTTYYGGTNGSGAIYSVHTDGTQFKPLYSFSALSDEVVGDNSDGGLPIDTLLLSSNVLYGTTTSGGSGSYGTVFRINTDGTDFTNIHTFAATDGDSPMAGLIMSSNVLYGTTTEGGYPYYAGTVFRMNTDGSHFTNIYEFTAGNDGAGPEAALVLSDDTLYGVTSTGGSNSGTGVIFSVSTSGKNFTPLFTFLKVGSGAFGTNATGGTPRTRLVLDGDTLYGAASRGGTNGTGVIYSINTSGSGFTIVHAFGPGAYNGYGDYTNTDGETPEGDLFLSGDTLYGSTIAGGLSVNYAGALFSVNTDGSGFTNIYFFQPVYDSDSIYIGGAGPFAGPILVSNTLYGPTTQGGVNSTGNIYAINLSGASSAPPSLAFQVVSNSLSLTWTNASLQATPSLDLPFTNVPSAISPYPVTNNAAQQFFRLVGN